MNSLLLDQLLSLLLCLFLFFVKHFEPAFDDKVKHYIVCVESRNKRGFSLGSYQALICNITVGNSS